jgi:hypothetical protein
MRAGAIDCALYPLYVLGETEILLNVLPRVAAHFPAEIRLLEQPIHVGGHAHYVELVNEQASPFVDHDVWNACVARGDNGKCRGLSFKDCDGGSFCISV